MAKLREKCLKQAKLIIFFTGRQPSAFPSRCHILRYAQSEPRSVVLTLPIPTSSLRTVGPQHPTRCLTGLYASRVDQTTDLSSVIHFSKFRYILSRRLDSVLKCINLPLSRHQSLISEEGYAQPETCRQHVSNNY